MGELLITEKQATYFDVRAYSQWSPYLEKCCLLLSANSSYEHAEEDIKQLTGMSVSRGTQQRLVQRYEFELLTVKEAVSSTSAQEPKLPLQEFELPTAKEAVSSTGPQGPKLPPQEFELPTAKKAVSEISPQEPKVLAHELKLPTVKEVVEEMSIDGGKVRLRTPQGRPCEWRDYKGVNLHDLGVAAFFRDNAGLVKWVNQQPLANPLVSIGDGHDGVWNLFAEIGPTIFRLEILDWYHLMENLEKVGGSRSRLARVKALLWSGKVDAALKEFDDWEHPRVDNFRAYVTKHRHRIVNYGYYQAEGISIGSGEVESTIKQVAARVKLSGAQWKAANVPQVLRHLAA